MQPLRDTKLLLCGTPASVAAGLTRSFLRIAGRDWTFRADVRGRQRALFPELVVGKVHTLLPASSVTIRRHVQVRAEATPFGPEYYDYLYRRRRAPRSIELGATA